MFKGKRPSLGLFRGKNLLQTYLRAKIFTKPIYKKEPSSSLFKGKTYAKLVSENVGQVRLQEVYEKEKFGDN